MKAAVLGTGNVGATIGKKLLELGYSVMMGSRTADNAKALQFADSHNNASAGTFDEAAAFGDVIFNCISGAGTLPAFSTISPNNAKGKIIIDISNPLDFSNGMPPTLFAVNNTSLGEQLQQLLPNAHVVKTLNTMWCGLMVNPGLIGNGQHQVFMSGNSAAAKKQVVEILNRFGWETPFILDLGDITTARGTEMYLPLWLRIWQSTGNSTFNIRIVS